MFCFVVLKVWLVVLYVLFDCVICFGWLCNMFVLIVLYVLFGCVICFGWLCYTFVLVMLYVLFSWCICVVSTEVVFDSLFDTHVVLFD